MRIEEIIAGMEARYGFHDELVTELRGAWKTLLDAEACMEQARPARVSIVVSALR